MCGNLKFAEWLICCIWWGFASPGPNKPSMYVGTSFCRKWMHHHFESKRTAMALCSCTITLTAVDSVILSQVRQSAASSKTSYGADLTGVPFNMQTLNTCNYLNYRLITEVFNHSKRCQSQCSCQIVVVKAGNKHKCKWVIALPSIVILGIIGAVAKDFFNSQIEMKIVNQMEELERTGKKEHVVFLVSNNPEISEKLCSKNASTSQLNRASGRRNNTACMNKQVKCILVKKNIDHNKYCCLSHYVIYFE